MTPPKDETPSGRGKGFQGNQKSKRIDSNEPAYFLGTDNLRHLRALLALMRRPISRHEIDSIAGCANGPDLISNLRALGLPKETHLICDRIKFIDRDGKPCWPGVYWLSEKGKRLVNAWLAKQKKGGAA